MKTSLLLIASALMSFGLSAQYTGYSIKAGPSVAFQRWDRLEQSPLVGYHVDVQVESISDIEPRTLYASLGFHRRGSAIRYPRFVGQDLNGNRIDRRALTEKYEFNNLSVAFGGKQLTSIGNVRAHVALALRGEYTLSTNLNEGLLANTGFAVFRPTEEFVTPFMYGIDLGGGIDFSISNVLDLLIELRVSPDFSRQYFQPPIANVILPGSNNPQTTPELSINNFTTELSVGIRFVRYTGVDLE